MRRTSKRLNQRLIFAIKTWVFLFIAGSQFRNPGLFEVNKATIAEDKTEQSTPDNRALEVAVGSDLEGTAEIRVAIVESGKDLQIASVRGNTLFGLGNV